MSMKVCFTGVGMLGPYRIPRYQWENAARHAGIMVSANMKKGCVLVHEEGMHGSKVDKALAVSAIRMSYEEFAGELVMSGVKEVAGLDIMSALEAAEMASPYPRQHRPHRRAFSDSESKKQEAFEKSCHDMMDSNPMWGSF